MRNASQQKTKPAALRQHEQRHRITGRLKELDAKVDQLMAVNDRLAAAIEALTQGQKGRRTKAA